MNTTKHAILALTSITGLGLLAGTADAALIGHWKFDGNLTDSVGSLDATAVGDAAAGTTNGNIGGAISFDGVDDAAFIASSVISGAEFSISFWEFSPADATVASGYMLAAGSGGVGYDEIYLRRFGSDSYAGAVSADFPGLGEAVVSRGVWHHSLVTHTASGGGTTTWYVDGALTLTQTGDTWTTLNNNLYLGNRENLARDFEGLLDDLQVYDETLTLADAAFLTANPGSVVPEPTTTALLGLGGLALIFRRRN